MKNRNEQDIRKRALLAIVVSGFTTALGVGLFSFTLPLVSLDAKISGTWLGTGFAGFFLARLLAGPLGGMWADRSAPRTPLLMASLIGSFIPFAYFLHPALVSLYVIQFLLGIVSGLIRPVGLAVLGGNADDMELARWFRLHVLAFNVALVLGPLVGGFLYWDRAMEWVLVGLSLCFALAFLFILIMVPATIATKRDEYRGAESPSRRSGFVALLVGLFGRSLGVGLTIAFYPIFLAMKLGHDGMLVGLLFSLPALVTCAGLLVRREGDSDRNVLGLLVSAMGLFSVGSCNDIWQFVLAGIVVGLGAAFSMVETMTLASRSSHAQGKVFGATQVVTGGGFILGPLFGGIALQQFGDLAMGFKLAGILGGLCFIPMVMHLLRGKKGLAYVSSACLLVVCVGSALFLHDGGVHAEDDGLYRYTDVAMGTVVNLTLDADSSKAADDAARKAMAFMRTVQRDLDYRDPQGSVGRINRAAGKHFVEPTSRTYDLIRRTVAFSQVTGGVFDPTIGALTTSPLYYALDETMARSKKDLVDYRLVQFNETSRRIRLPRRGMALDLGGIAKGTIIDATVTLLRKLGIRAGIVEAGGDFYCFGDREWTVGIRHPRDDRVFGSIRVREKGVCGSGDYQQFVTQEIEGETTLRHHIIDPKDMEPAAKSAGVTVVAESAEKADALATTLFIMGPDKGLEFLGEHYPRAAAMWFSSDLSVSVTENFPQ